MLMIKEMYAAVAGLKHTHCLCDMKNKIMSVMTNKKILHCLLNFFLYNLR